MLLHFIAFLFSTYNDFLQYNPLPWGVGPYPCLNPERVHERINTIHKHTLQNAGTGVYRFRCELCHYTYEMNSKDFISGGYSSSTPIGIFHRRPKRAFKTPEELMTKREECVQVIKQIVVEGGISSIEDVIQTLPSQHAFMSIYFPKTLREIIPRKKQVAKRKSKMSTKIVERQEMTDEAMLQQAKDCYAKHCSQLIPSRVTIFVFRKRLNKRHYMTEIKDMPRTLAFVESVLETKDEYKKRAALQSIKILKEQRQDFTMDDVYHMMKKKTRDKELDNFIQNAMTTGHQASEEC